MFEGMSPSEIQYCEAIRAKDAALRTLIAKRTADGQPARLLAYLIDLKNTLGNLNNDISFVASLLVKPFLRERFGVEFYAASKPQVAAGLDVDCTMPDGTRIVGEIKTTRPYQPGFGATQKKEIRKDLLRLAASKAAHRFMFVTDADSYHMLCNRAFASHIPGVEIVDLVRGESFVCPHQIGTDD